MTFGRGTHTGSRAQLGQGPQEVVAIANQSITQSDDLHVGLTSGQFTANTKAVTGNPNDLHSANAAMTTEK